MRHPAPQTTRRNLLLAAGSTILLGATALHAGNGWVFNAPNGGWEYPAFWTVTLVVQALLGPGAFSVGRLLPTSLPGLVRA